MSSGAEPTFIDFVLEGGIVRGRIQTGLGRVSDVLNQADQDYMTVEEATVMSVLTSYAAQPGAGDRPITLRPRAPVTKKR